MHFWGISRVRPPRAAALLPRRAASAGGQLRQRSRARPGRGGRAAGSAGGHTAMAKMASHCLVQWFCFCCHCSLLFCCFVVWLFLFRCLLFVVLVPCFWVLCGKLFVKDCARWGPFEKKPRVGPFLVLALQGTKGKTTLICENSWTMPRSFCLAFCNKEIRLKAINQTLGMPLYHQKGCPVIHNESISGVSTTSQ